MVNELGIEHWKVSLGYGMVQVGVFLMVLFLSQYGLPALLAGLTGFAAIWIMVDWKVKQRAVSGRRKAEA